MVGGMKETDTLILEKLRNEDQKRKMAEFRKTSRNKTMISEIKSKLEKMYEQVNNYYCFEKVEEVEMEHFNNKRKIQN